jgi:Cu2+-exporting ATPase
MTASACFHCALPVDQDDEFQVEIDGELKPVCCPGCKAVAELIRDSGMSGYYDLREAPQPGVGRPSDDATEWQVFDRSDMLEAFARLDESRAEATLYVGKMYCAACGWLIESTLAGQKGVESAEVNPVTHRLRVAWRRDDTRFSSILGVLASLGYDPQPLAPASASRPEVAEQRSALKRLLVASLGMMQAMMFAIGLYAGDFQGMDADMQLFLGAAIFCRRMAGYSTPQLRHGSAGLNRGRCCVYCLDIRNAHGRRSCLVRLRGDVRVLPDARPFSRNARSSSVD